MGLELRAGISFCDVSDRLLFLDIDQDRYFCLQPTAEQGFRALIAKRGANAEGSQSLAGMLRSGVLVETDSPRLPHPFRPPPAATGSLLDTLDRKAGLVPVAGALLRIFEARLALRRRPLHIILKDLASVKSSRRNLDADERRQIQIAANAFELTSRLVRSHDQCLPRSVALARHLASRDLPGNLMIGVKLRPFLAHAWVQSGPWLVNDRLDHIRSFTPILAV